MPFDKARRHRIYISGPITKGNRTHNFSQACEVQKWLMRFGFAPLNPTLSTMHPDAYRISHEDWLACDLPWVEVADAVFRLPGDSVGADAECEHAINCGIPVFRSFQELFGWRVGKCK